MEHEKLLEKALRWFSSPNQSLKMAALELFSQEELEAAVENKKKSDEEKNEEKFNKIFKRCQKMFHIGDVIWSDDSTDELPNVIISEPFIDTDMHYHYDWDHYGKGIFVKTIRVSNGEPCVINGKVHTSYVYLNELLKKHDSSNEDLCHRKAFVDFNDFYKTENQDKEYRIKKLNERIQDAQITIGECTKEIQELEPYHPETFNQQKANEIAEKYKDM